MPEVPPEVEGLVELYFGKPLTAVSEADAIEIAYSQEELSEMPELRERYESLKQDEPLAAAAAYISSARDNGSPVPEEFVRLVTFCGDLLKRSEQVAKERDRLRRELSRCRAKERGSLLPVQTRSLLRILGAIITHQPYNFDIKALRNKAIKMIRDLMPENASTDEGTILGWCREAAKEVAGSRDGP